MTVSDDVYAKLANVQKSYGELLTQLEKKSNALEITQEDLQAAHQRIRDLELRVRQMEEQQDETRQGRPHSHWKGSDHSDLY